MTRPDASADVVGAYVNPDDATQRILAANPDALLSAANAAAWNEGRRLLGRGITGRLDLAFETTPGGTSIPRLLALALDRELEVHMRYVGLAGVEWDVARVRARVAAGGYDIPGETIRERYDTSRRSLIRLLQWLTDLQLFDNSVNAPPILGREPRPRLLLHVIRGMLSDVAPVHSIPAWTKPIVVAALRDDRAMRSGGHRHKWRNRISMHASCTKLRTFSRR